MFLSKAPRIALASVLLFSALAMAGTTGNIQGTVTDSNGSELPGVTVSITSPNLQGSRTLVTDSNGKYRAVFLPPGNYELTATLTGFQTQKTTTKVMLDSTSTVNFALNQASVEEELIVTAERPVIDQTSTTAGSNLTEDFFTKVATGRDTQGVMAISPGVIDSDASGNLRVYGASGTENQYIIDGVNTTGIENNDNVTNLNFDFIQEIQVKTGGYEAEFGRATGGVVNVITKSGGNEFEGSVYAFFDDRDQVASARRVPVGSNFNGDTLEDFGFTIGGPIIKDKLWFFAGFNPTSFERYRATLNTPMDNGGGASWASVRGADEIVTTEREIDKWVAKLTYQLNENNTITFSANGDPQDAVFRDPSGTATTDIATEFESTNYILKWNSILSSVFTLDASYAVHEETQKDKAVDGNDLPMFWDRRSTPTSNAGGIGFHRPNLEGTRNDFNIKLGAFLGNHDVKVGFQLETTEFDDTRTYSGQTTYGLGVVRIDWPGHGIRIRRFAELVGPGEYAPIDQRAKTENEYSALFIQDSWAVLPNLTINLGYRTEVQKLKDHQGSTYHEFDDNNAPRIGFTWDFKGDGTSKIYGHWGTFFQNIPMDINNRAASPEILYFEWYDFVGGEPDSILDWTTEDVLNITQNSSPWFSAAFGGEATSISTNTKTINQDELILGMEYEFKPSWTVGFKYIARELNEAVEDLSFDAGHNYIIGNPGRDITFTWGEHDLDGDGTPDALRFYDFNGTLREFATGADVLITPEMVGMAAPKRDFKGYEFVLRKAYRDNWQFQFSYLNSDVEGNYEGGVLEDGQVDPGITSTFDIPSTTVNGDGTLPTEREHDFKFDGSFDFDFGLTMGASYRYRSGKGVSAFGESDVGNGAYGQFHLVKRGTASQLPATTSIDLHFEYAYRFSGRMELIGYADVFNVFNFQEITGVSEQFSFSTPNDIDVSAADFDQINDGIAFSGIGDPNAPWNRGKDAIVVQDLGDGIDWETNLYANRYYSWLEGQFGNLNELRSWYQAAGLEIDEDYLQPTNFQLGRRTRFGLRFRF